MRKIIILTILFLLTAGSALAIEQIVNIPCQDLPIPGGQCNPSYASTPAGYVARIYQFGLLAAGITAMGALVYGATKYILSAGNIFDQGEAKSQMLSAIYGLLLLLGAYLILNTINPDLVKLKDPSLDKIFKAAKTCTTADGLPGTIQIIDRREVCVVKDIQSTIQTRSSGPINFRLDPSFQFLNNLANPNQCYLQYQGVIRNDRCNFCPSKRYELIPDASGKDVCQIKTSGAPPCNTAYPIWVTNEFNKDICVAEE